MVEAGAEEEEGRVPASSFSVNQPVTPETPFPVPFLVPVALDWAVRAVVVPGASSCLTSQTLLKCCSEIGKALL